MASVDVASLLPPGIYRIVIAKLGSIGPDALTRREDGGVTVLPPDVQPDNDQKWQVDHLPNGNVAIVQPTGLRPAQALTYEGDPGSPNAGDKVIQQVQEFPTEWHVGIAPGFRQTLQVANSRLGIQIAPPKIYPPFLELGEREQLNWIFERVGDKV